MFAHQRKVHHALQLLLDAACLKLIWIFTTEARILSNPLLHEHVTAERSIAWTPSLLLIAPIWLVLSLRFHLYKAPQKASAHFLPLRAFENAVALAIAAVTVTFFSRQFGEFVSRMFVALMLPVAYCLFYLSRLTISAVTPYIQKHWEKRFRFAIIGDRQAARHFIEKLQEPHASRFRGLIVPEGHGTPLEGCTLRVLGTTRQMGELINKERLTRVVVLSASVPSLELEHCSQVLERMEVPVTCALDVSPDPIELNVSASYGLPFVEAIPMRFTRRQEIVKRAFDVAVGSATIVLLSPLMLLIAAIIRLTSQGPVLYRSLRIGRGGRGFVFLKFRSMYQSTDRRMVAAVNEQTGHLFKIKNDPRVTPIGRWLRRYSLDELPQLINIVRGEMSFVGPRPLPASDLEPDGMSKKYSAWSEGRASVQPGLTGLWQVSGRSDLPFEEMVNLDLAYVQNWSLVLDLRIILMTPMLVLRGSGAY